MWLTRTRYESLVRAEARSLALETQNAALLAQIEHERHRAENAVDALLVAKSALPITPVQGKPEPERGLFDDDPDELKRLMDEIKRDPAGTLIREGVGDETNA